MLFVTIVVLTVVYILNWNVARCAVVTGNSMNPALSNGKIVFINRISHIYDRYDVIVIKSKRLNKNIVKRIIGMPGDTVLIKNGYIYINGRKLNENYGNEKIQNGGIAETEQFLDKGEYFVLGDNRNDSIDSRKIGFIKEKEIVGKLW